MKIPTNYDWGNYIQDLDQISAYNIFAGKSNTEVQKLFSDNVIERTDEIRFMTIKPFQYYMIGFKQYLMSIEFDEDSAADAVSCFIRLVEEKLTNKPEYIIPIMDEIYPVVQHIAEHQLDYDADLIIYGDFTEMLSRILVLYEKTKLIDNISE